MSVLELKALCKQYNKEKESNPETAQSTRTKISHKMNSLSPEDRFAFIEEFRNASIAVNGQEPQTHTGYGVARKVYCELLLEDLIGDAIRKLNLTQNNNGNSPEIPEIEKRLSTSLSRLHGDQLNAFARSVDSFKLNPDMEQRAKNKHNHGLNVVKDALDKERTGRNNPETQTANETC